MTYFSEWRASGAEQQHLHGQIMISAVWSPAFEAARRTAAAAGRWVSRHVAQLQSASAPLSSRFRLKVHKQTLAGVGRGLLVAYSSIAIGASVIVLSNYARAHAALHTFDRTERADAGSLG